MVEHAYLEAATVLDETLFEGGFEVLGVGGIAAAIDDNHGLLTQDDLILKIDDCPHIQLMDPVLF